MVVLLYRWECGSLVAAMVRQLWRLSCNGDYDNFSGVIMVFDKLSDFYFFVLHVFHYTSHDVMYYHID